MLFNDIRVPRENLPRQLGAMAATLVAAFAACATPGSASAQEAAGGFAGAKPGAVTVALADAIRTNQFEWLSEAPMETIKGTAPGVQGTFRTNLARLSETTGEVQVPVATMKTGNPIRDGHVRSKDWLDADAHPNITFKIEQVEKVVVTGIKATLTVAGAFTLHGVTKRMTVPVALTWMAAGEKTKSVPGDWLKFELKFAVKLADYAVAGKRGIVGKKVGESIQIEGVLYGHTK